MGNIVARGTRCQQFHVKRGETSTGRSQQCGAFVVLCSALHHPERMPHERRAAEARTISANRES